MHMRTMPPFHATRAIAQTSRRSRRGLPPSRSPVLMRRSPPSTSSGAVVQAVRHSSLLYCTYFSSPVSRVSRISVILTSARAALRVALSSISRPRDPWDVSNSHFSACPRRLYTQIPLHPIMHAAAECVALDKARSPRNLWHSTLPCD